MKNKLAKTLLSFAMAAVISCMSLVASASGVAEGNFSANVLSNSDNGGISTLKSSPPNNASGSGQASLPYTAQPYPIYAGHSCYTSYYFKTSTGKLTLDYHMYAVQPAEGYRSMVFQLFEGKNGLLWNVNWSFVASESRSFYDTVNEDVIDKPTKTYDGTVTFSGLKANTMYCICIVNTTAESSNSSYTNSICGTIDISE